MKISFFKTWLLRASYRWRTFTRIKKIGLLFLLGYTFFLLGLGAKIITFPTWFYLNVTESAPIGIYREIKGGSLSPGAYVLVYPRERLSLFQSKDEPLPSFFLLKKLQGLPGSSYTVFSDGVAISHAFYPTKQHASNGRLLPHLPIGTFFLEKNQYLVFNDAPNSYDSRYFGAIPQEDIYAVVEPICIFSDFFKKGVLLYEAIR